MSQEEKFQNQYRIPSARLKGWDYSSSGYYFVTICTRDHRCYFGKIVNQKMELSKMGEIVEKFWLEIPEHFSNVDLDFFVVMPNHIHGIIIIESQVEQCRDAINRVSTPGGGVTSRHNPMGHGTLGEIIRWYKGRCSFEINHLQGGSFFWQPRFHDHVIRNEKSYQEICRYIFENPARWLEDESFSAE